MKSILQQNCWLEACRYRIHHRGQKKTKEYSFVGPVEGTVLPCGPRTQRFYQSLVALRGPPSSQARRFSTSAPGAHGRSEELPRERWRGKRTTREPAATGE